MCSSDLHSRRSNRAPRRTSTPDPVARESPLPRGARTKPSDDAPTGGRIRWPLAWLVFVTFAALYASSAGARGYSVDGDFAYRLARDIRNVLDQADYQWRAPRELSPEEPESPKGEGAIRRWLRSVFKDFGGFANRNLDAFFSAIGRVLQFIFSGFKAPNLPSGNTTVDWMSGLKLLAYVLLAAAVAGLAWIVLRLRRSRPTTRAAAAIPAPSAIPDLEAESVSAELLPEDGWLAMASEKAALGEWRLALRAVYLGALAHLARRELLRLAPSKSNQIGRAHV